jgi:hypothetical protein
MAARLRASVHHAHTARRRVVNAARFTARAITLHMTSEYRVDASLYYARAADEAR